VVEMHTASAASKKVGLESAAPAAERDGGASQEWYWSRDEEPGALTRQPDGVVCGADSGWARTACSHVGSRELCEPIEFASARVEGG